MKVKHIHPWSNKPIDPYDINDTSLKIILDYAGSLDTDAVKKKDLDVYLKDLTNSEIVGEINPSLFTRFVGDDILHEANNNLILKKRLAATNYAIKVDINKKGIVTKIYPIDTSEVDSTSRIDWKKVINKPKTLKDYNIVDIMGKNQAVTLKGLTTVDKVYPVADLTPIPYSKLSTKKAEYGASLTVGSIIAKIEGTDTTGFYLCNKAKITSKTDPELVKFLTGDPKATEAFLPDSSAGDRDRFLLTGLSIRSYIKRDY